MGATIPEPDLPFSMMDDRTPDPSQAAALQGPDQTPRRAGGGPARVGVRTEQHEVGRPPQPLAQADQAGGDLEPGRAVSGDGERGCAPGRQFGFERASQVEQVRQGFDRPDAGLRSGQVADHAADIEGDEIEGED